MFAFQLATLRGLLRLLQPLPHFRIFALLQGRRLVLRPLRSFRISMARLPHSALIIEKSLALQHGMGLLGKSVILVSHHKFCESLSDLMRPDKGVIQIFFGHQQLELLEHQVLLRIAVVCSRSTKPLTTSPYCLLVIIWP